MNQFATLVETHGDALLKSWVSAVQRGHYAKSSSPDQMRQQLPTLLPPLIAGLRHGSTPGSVPTVGATDPSPRRFGFYVQELVREYGLLGGVLLDLAEESGAALSMSDLRVFAHFMASAVAQGVAAHVHLRADVDQSDEVATNPAPSDPWRNDAGKDRLPVQSRNGCETSDLEKLQELFMEAPVPMCIHEGSLHTFTFANSAYRALVAGRELVGKSLLDALPELRGQGFDTLLAGVTSTGEPYTGREMPVRLANAPAGATQYFNFAYQPRRNPEGRVTSVLVVGTDVTEQVDARKRIEAESRLLRQSEERLRRVVEATGAGMWELDVATLQVTARRAAARAPRISLRGSHQARGGHRRRPSRGSAGDWRGHPGSVRPQRKPALPSRVPHP